MVMKKDLHFVDLFAGCGGLSLGLEKAGFKPVMVNELNNDALNTYLLNRINEFPYLSKKPFFSNDIKDLPSPSGQDITFEKFNLDKCAVIRFSWFVNNRKIIKYKRKLQKFLDDNEYKATSPFMINRYDSPWKLPFMRRNEILVKID